MELVVFKEKMNNGKATASMVIGIIGLVASFLPILGLPLNILGIILGILGLKSEKRGKAKAGVIMNGIGLMVSITYLIIIVVIIKLYMKNRHYIKNWKVNSNETYVYQ